MMWIVLRTFLLTTLLLLVGEPIIAQRLIAHPTFYQKKKSDGLVSNKIYNLHTAKNGLMYIAHSKGLSTYDGNVFKYISNTRFPYAEVTNIIETDDGNIYCETFNNCLMKVSADSLVFIKYFNNGNGYVPSAGYKNLILSKAQDSLFIYNSNTQKIWGDIISNTQNTSVNHSLIVFASYYQITSKEWHFLTLDQNLKYSFHPSIVNSYSNYHLHNNQLFLVKNKFANNIYHFNTNTNYSLPQANTTVNYIQYFDSTIWVCSNDGIYYWNSSIGLSSLQHILPGKKTTGIVKTFDNVYAVSTLDEGLLLMPNILMKDLQLPDDKIRTINGFGNNLYVATEDEQLLQYDATTFQLINSTSTRGSIISSFVEKGGNRIWCNAGQNFLLDNGKMTKLNFSMKDLSYVGNAGILSTNTGIFLIKNHDTAEWIQSLTDGENELGLRQFKYFKGAFVAAAKYSKAAQSIYISTYTGLYQLSISNGKINKLPEPNCVLTDIGIHNDSLILATKDRGILVYDGSQYHQWHKEELPNDLFYTIQQYDSAIWIVGEQGIYRITGDQVYIYNSNMGIDFENRISLYVDDSNVFLSNGKQLQFFPLDRTKIQDYIPKLHIHKIVNSNTGETLKTLKSIGHEDNSIAIHFNLISFAHGDNATVAYSINGATPRRLSSKERVLSLNNLNPDEYTIILYPVINGRTYWKQGQSITFHITPPFYKKWWFTILMMATAAGLVYVISRKILYNWKREAIRKETQLLLEKELDKSILSSIRAQMNPHFLFNSLNTIQSYIYANDKKNASEYISKFSNLTRNILEMSNRDTITVAEEVNTLSLYLELEKMRFEDSFEYHITVADDLNIDYIRIPPMLVQPYVENAIKHGLLHKKTHRILNLSFHQVGHMLEIIVDDNGIGRKRSQELNNIKNRHHTPFAMSANKKRLEILNHNTKDVRLSIEDKYSSLGQPLGTKVTILLPIQSK